MGHTRHSQSVFKEVEIINMKCQKINVQASILAWFRVREPPRGGPGDHAGMGTLKTTKRSLFGTLFLEHIYDRCCTFVVTDSVMFSKSLFCYSLAPKAPTHQFEGHVGTNLMTFPINLGKWQLRFRSREDTKIKLSRVCVSL